MAAPKKTPSPRAPKKTAAAESSTPRAPAKTRAPTRAVPAPENSRPTLATSHRKTSVAADAKPVRAKAAAKKAVPAPGTATPRPTAVKTAKGAALLASVASKGAELPLPARARARKAKALDQVDDAAELGKVMANASIDKKALQVEVIDVRGRLDYADVLVLASGRTERQTVAIAQAMEDEAKKKLGRRSISVEGQSTGIWILLDFGDVVAHVFTEDARHMYDLDGLFTDAEKIAFEG